MNIAESKNILIAYRMVNPRIFIKSNYGICRLNPLSIKILEEKVSGLLAQPVRSQLFGILGDDSITTNEYAELRKKGAFSAATKRESARPIYPYSLLDNIFNKKN